MNWTITVGAVCGAAGLVTVAPAAADADSGGPAGTDQGLAVGPGTHERKARTSGRPPRRGAADANSERPGGRGTPVPDGDTDTASHPPDCRHWPYWPPFVPPVDPEVGNRNALFAGGAEAAPAVPPLSLVTAMTTSSRVSEGAGPATATVTAATAPLSPPSGGPMIPSPPPPPAPSPRPPAGPPEPAPASSAPPARSATPPPAAPQAADLAPDLTDATVQALPGLVGLAVLTGAGGLLGYRQAKAGFALHAAGTARFLP